MRNILFSAMLGASAFALSSCSDSQSSAAPEGAQTPQAAAPAKPFVTGADAAAAATLQAGMADLAKRIAEGMPQAEIETAIGGLVAAAPERAVLDFLASGHRKLDASISKRIAYLASVDAFERFKSEDAQFYQALFTARGYGFPANRDEAMAVLQKPATGKSRNVMWLTAELLLAKPDPDKNEARRLLEEAKAMGSGEAIKMHETL